MTKTNNQPLVDIIVPAFNMELYIDRCIQSIVDQSYENIRLIIVDDGSTDNTLSICKRWSEIDKRINVLHKKNSGVSSARNLALKNIIGDFVLFIDSDDWIDSDMIKIMMENIINTNSDVVVCGFNYINEESNVIEKSFIYDKKQVLNRDEAVLGIFGDLSTMVWNKIFRKSIISKEDIFNEKLNIGEDELWIIQVLYKAKKVSIVNKALYNYLIRQGSLFHDYTLSKNKLSEIKSQILVEDEIKKFNSPELLIEAQKRMYYCCHNIMKIAYYDNNKEIYNEMSKISTKERSVWLKSQKRISTRLRRYLLEFMMKNNFPKSWVKLLDEKICNRYIKGFFRV